MATQSNLRTAGVAGHRPIPGAKPRRTFAGIALACTVVLAISGDASAGKLDAYDPRPADGDVLMPMPCGGHMVFRKVVTSDYQGTLLDTLLDDRRVVLGSPDEDSAYSEYSHTSYVAGAFAEKDEGKQSGSRYFLIGKYEVSQAQYTAVMSEGRDCPKNDFKETLPVTSVSWFDAVDFTRRYTAWLYKHALDKVPAFLGTPGFVRLPTEDEWEFAERGGLAVSTNEFQRRVPLPDGQQLQGYAWFAGQASADGELQPIGTTEHANPLGLYDMLGNASEMVFDPFHLIRGTREHGLAGGFVAKGGSFETPKSEMRSSMREELSYFNARTKDETKARQMGFRVAMTDVAMPDLRSINALKADWNAERQVTTNLPENPLIQLSVMAKNEADPVMRRSLDNIRIELTRQFAENKEAADDAHEANILGIISMQESLGEMLGQYNSAANLEAYYRANAGGADASGAEHDNLEIARLSHQKDKIADDFLGTAEVYLDLLTRLAERYDRDDKGADAVRSEIRLVYAELLNPARPRPERAKIALNLLRVLNVLHKTGDRAKMKMLEDVFGPLNFYQSR